MCGLNAIITENNCELPVHYLMKMHSKLYHRGPDDEGFLSWKPDKELKQTLNFDNLSTGQVLFSHRRLSILDVLSHAVQPMVNKQKTLAIIFNGEIYNFLEIKNELEVLGYSFRTSSDTEVLLAAYEEWGPQALPKLIGMFAFIILDLRKSCLFIARDCFGIKPLFIVKKNKKLYLSSEINPLLSISEISRKVNPQSLYNYLRFGLSDNNLETLFADIKHFPPAHYAEVDLKTLSFTFTKYWEPRLGTSSYSLPEAVEHFRALFFDNIKLHLRSDVPVGVALSGGIDSSAVVMGIRRIGGPNLNIKTFSYCATNSIYNEEVWIDTVVKAAQAESYKTQISASTLWNDLERIIKIQGEPFGSTSIYAQFQVYELAKTQNVKVMLDGQGADELFAGYRPYLAKRLISLIKQKDLQDVYAFIKSVIQAPDIKMSRLFAQVASYYMPSIFENLGRKIMGESLTPTWLNQNWFAKRGVKFDILPYKRLSSLKEALLESLTTTVLPALLRYQDRNSMHFSIESRVPFLTPQLTEFAYSLNEDLLISKNGESKFLLREAMKGIVPDIILERKDKIGFSTPEQDWLKELKSNIEEQFRDSSLNSIPALNMEEIIKEFNQFTVGSKHNDFKLWRWLNLIKWSELYNIDYIS